MGIGNSVLIERLLRCELCSSSETTFGTEEIVGIEPPDQETAAGSPPSLKPSAARHRPVVQHPVPESREASVGLFSISAKRENQNRSLRGTLARQQNGSPTATPGQSAPSTPRRQAPRLYHSDTNLTNADAIESRDWQKITDTVTANPKGAYLIYSPGNNGSWYIQWSDKFIPDAWLFSCPKDVSGIPSYKFSANKKDEIVRGVHSSSSSYCLGFVLFIKATKRYNGSLLLLKPFFTNAVEKPDVFEPVTLGLHHGTSAEVRLLTGHSTEVVDDLALYDGAVAVVGSRGPTALAELAHPSGAKIPLPAFVAVGAQYGSGISFQDHA